MHCVTFDRSAGCWLSSAWSIDASSSRGRRSSDSRSHPESDKVSERHLVHRKCTSGCLSQLRYESRDTMVAIQSCSWIIVIKESGNGCCESDSRINEAPLHRVEIEAMHITWELVDHLLKPTENVHLWAHDTGRVTVASTRQIASHVRRLPLASLRVEAEQNITNL